jgi:hypothetical protein
MALGHRNEVMDWVPPCLTLDESVVERIRSSTSLGDRPSRVDHVNMFKCTMIGN